MSPRLPASSVVLTFVLLASALLTPLLAEPAEAFGERPYDWNQVTAGTSHLDVYAGQIVAQSFVSADTYLLLNVSLRLRNTGVQPDSLNVTIRADASGVPAAAYLAAANLFLVPGGAPANVNVPLAPAATLTRGVTYWIVAAHAGPLAEAYEWHHSSANVYAQGKPMVDQGAGWIDVGLLTDMVFLTYGRELAANVSVGLASDTATVPAEGLVTFTVSYNNTGTQVARRVWVNLTVPADLAYIADNASGSSTAYPRYAFGDVDNNPHAFDVTLRVKVGVEPGSILTVSANLAYVDGAWSPRTGSSDSAAVTVGLVTKELYLTPRPGGPPHALVPSRPTGGIATQTNISVVQTTTYDFDLSPPLARSFRATGGTVVLYLDSRNHGPRTLDLDMTLMDWNGVSLIPVTNIRYSVVTNAFDDHERFSFTFNAFDYTFALGQQVRLRALLLGSSDEDANLAMNSTFAASRVELVTSTYVRIDACEFRDGVGIATVWSPKDALVVRANVSDPLGAPEITAVRINVTAPGGTRVADYVPMTILATDASNPPAWVLVEYALPPPLENGTYFVRVTAIESNGVVDVAEGSALVRAPRFTLQKTASAANVKGGDRFHYYLWYNNTGAGPAGRVWLNDSIPSQVNFLTSSDPGAMTGSYNWSWASVGIGAHVLDIEVQVRGGITDPYFRNAASVNFTDEKGHRWDVVLAILDVVLRGPVISFSKSSAKIGLHPNETIAYAFEISNTGDPAQTLWLNDTLPSGLSYVADTAASVGGTTTVVGNVVRFRFSNLVSGATWTFTLTARAAPGLVRGTALLNAAVLEYTNENGVGLPPKAASHSVTVLAPQIQTAAIATSTAAANPGEAVPFVLDYANSGNEAARDLWINLTLDPYLVLVNASSPAAGTGPDVRFTLSNVAVGAHRLNLNLSVVPGVPDRRDLAVQGTIDYTDGLGNSYPVVTIAPETVQAKAPRISVGVIPGLATMEAGTRRTFTVTHTNAGSGTAGNVWLNLSLPATFIYVADTADGSRSVQGSSYAWHWSGQPPGPKSFTLTVAAKLAVADGTSSNLTFDLAYTDTGGNPRNATSATAVVSFVAPAIEVQIAANRAEVLSGDTFSYTLIVRNLGSMSARYLWLVDSVESRLEVVSYTSRVRAEGSPDLNWTFEDVGPAHEEVITLTVRVRDGLSARTPIANVLEAVFTNSQGDILGYVRSTPVIVIVAADLMPVLYILLAGLGAGAVALFAVYRRMNVDIEEVFLVYRDGVLMYHLSRSLVQEKDEDVLSGMLTAVQEFVRDAFRYGEHRELHQLDFGDYRILIERGKTVYLAVVYSGKESPAIRKKVRSVLDHIETTYGPELAVWDGDMDKIVGARDAIRDHLFKSNTRLPRHEPIRG